MATTTTSSRSGRPTRSPRGRNASSSRPQDAIALLKADHRDVEQLFEQFEKATSKRKKRSLVDEMITELVRHHVEDEEQELFPKLRDVATRTELRELGESLASAKRDAPTRPDVQPATTGGQPAETYQSSGFSV